MFTATKFLALFTLTIMSKIAAASRLDECAARKCSKCEDLVWTTSPSDGCVVAVNPCQLENENCQRKERGEDELYEISKEDCQKICEETMCSAIWEPICGSYNNTLKTFPNECEMNKYICTYGQVYTVHCYRACEEN